MRADAICSREHRQGLLMTSFRACGAANTHMLGGGRKSLVSAERFILLQSCANLSFQCKEPQLAYGCVHHACEAYTFQESTYFSNSAQVSII